MTRIVLVAAVANGHVIGRAGGLPWRIPEDMERFRALTVGHPVVMGRRTWDSLPDRFRPLPERRNIVLTRDSGWTAEGAERAGSLTEAVALAGDAERVSVIGGGAVFAEALPLADEIRLTEIALDVEGDTFFPPLDGTGLAEVARENVVAADGTRLAFVTYTR